MPTQRDEVTQPHVGTLFASVASGDIANPETRLAFVPQATEVREALGSAEVNNVNFVTRGTAPFICVPTTSRGDILLLRDLWELEFDLFSANVHAEAHYVVASLRETRGSVVSDELANFTVLEGGSRCRTFEPDLLAPSSRRSPRQLFFHFIGGIRSQTDLADRLRSLPPLIEGLTQGST